MRIEELTTEVPVTFLVRIGNQQLSFETKIIEVIPKKHLVLAAPVFRDQKVLSFRGKNLIVDVIAQPPNDKPQLFKNVTVTTMKKGEDFCYNLSTIAESKAYNRRQNFRCYLGISTSLQLGMNRLAVPVIVRDVSVSGFAVVSDTDLLLMENQVLHIVVNDYIEETAENYSFHLYGLLTRTQVLENGKFLYGCRLNNPVPGLEAYIMKKERLRLKKSNGGNL